MDILRFLDEIENDLYIPRIIADRSNPLEAYSNMEIRMGYRFDKRVIHEILMTLVAPQLETLTQRGNPVPPVLQVLTALRFYATGSFQIVSADLHGISQPTVSRIVKNVSHLISEHLPNYIHFPKDLRKVQRRFFNIKRFPGVIGCIDCTHMYMQCPARVNGEVFRNRKGRFSLNIQVIGGPDLEIYDIVCPWPGSVHDSRIFNNSSAKLRFDQGNLKGILLGDSG